MKEFTVDGSTTEVPLDDNGNPKQYSMPDKGNRAARGSDGSWLVYDDEGNVVRSKIRSKIRGQGPSKIRGQGKAR